MKSSRFSFCFVALLLAALTFTSPANADTHPRTWVSSTGSDMNACLRTSPCATFAGALLNTDPGGEIDCVDAGDYGLVSINKALTIDCGGTFGSILVPAGMSGILINAGVNDTVTIRNLSIYNTLQNGSTGIFYSSAKAVHVENVRISGFTACVAASVSGSSLLTIDNATLTDCFQGTSASTTSGTVVVNVNNSRITNAGTGLRADNGSRVTVRDSTIYFNSLGISQGGSTTLGSTVTAINNTFGYSSTAALQSQTGEFILAYGNSFVNDVVAFNPNGGMIFTGSDNNNSGSVQGTANGGSVPKF